MKKLSYLLIILVAGAWLYGKCSHKETDSPDVLKQVRVAVKTANLRTGPGTSYGFVLDAKGNRRQVSNGTVLDVVAEKKGWYEVRLKGDSVITAYIKQSLCTDLKPSTSRKTGGAKGTVKRSESPSPSVQEQPTEEPPSSSTPPPADEVVEEVTNGSVSQDDVIF
ncbi:MAG: hypothetical protein J6W75_01930 [Bacteroidaceae bacterium]|nr:hypothetical protein [Bacteroidaceae bacterium]